MTRGEATGHEKRLRETRDVTNRPQPVFVLVLAY